MSKAFTRAWLIAFASAASFFSAAKAQMYPSTPIRMVVGFPAGDTTDVMARTIGAKMAERFGQQMTIDKRPGASGIIGADIVAKAKPDAIKIGYNYLQRV